MITKSQIKYVHSLGIKKYRDQERCFIAEGPKVVTDLFPLLHCKNLFVTPDFKDQLKKTHLDRCEEVIEVTQKELERLSLLRTPRGALALFEYVDGMTDYQTMETISQQELCIALDGVQDPGNLGTILRIADWFGITHIFASKETVDVYSPKVVQATMGAIGRVMVHYIDLKDFLEHCSRTTYLWGTFLDGSNIYQEELQNKGIIVMGNEGKGISPDLARLINKRLFIPNYPMGRSTSESLNVAVATAITVAEFRRSHLG